MTENPDKDKPIEIVQKYIEKISLLSDYSREEILKIIQQKKKENKGISDIGALYIIKNELELIFFGGIVDTNKKIEIENLSFEELYRVIRLDESYFPRFIEKFIKFFDLDRIRGLITREDLDSYDVGERSAFRVIKEMTAEQLTALVRKTKVIDYMLYKDYSLFDSVDDDDVPHLLSIFANKCQEAVTDKIQEFFLDGNVPVLHGVMIYWTDLFYDDYYDDPIKEEDNLELLFTGFENVSLEVDWKAIIENDRHNIFATLYSIDGIRHHLTRSMNFFRHDLSYLRDLKDTIESKIRESFQQENVKAIRFLTESGIINHFIGEGSISDYFMGVEKEGEQTRLFRIVLKNALAQASIPDYFEKLINVIENTAYVYREGMRNTFSSIIRETFDAEKLDEYPEIGFYISRLRYLRNFRKNKIGITTFYDLTF